jgi:hypothetical protein
LYFLLNISGSVLGFRYWPCPLLKLVNHFEFVVF